MPELPEVETVRRGLVKVLVGRELVGVDIRDGRLTAPADPTAVAHELLGAVVTGVGRRGKYLAVGLDDGRTLVCHLRMTGWFHHVTELTRAPAPAGGVRAGRRHLAALQRPAAVRHDAADRAGRARGLLARPGRAGAAGRRLDGARSCARRCGDARRR